MTPTACGLLRGSSHVQYSQLDSSGQNLLNLLLTKPAKYI